MIARSAFIFALLLPLVSSAKCPFPDVYNPIDGSCYSVVHLSAPWTPALAVCKLVNGEMVIPRTTFENNEFSQYVQDSHVNETWLGGRLTLFNIVLGSDGSLLTYTNWAKGQPAKGKCVKMNEDGLWYTEECGNSLRFFCKYQPTTDVPMTTTTMEEPKTIGTVAPKDPEGPKETITTEAPKENVTTEGPKEEPSTEAPKENATTEGPKEEPSTEAPKENVTTEGPKEEPSTEAPKENVTTEGPKEEPSTEAPKENVTTEGPKEEPSSEAPKENVTTEGPKEEPSTEAPKESTTTAQPTTTSKATTAVSVANTTLPPTTPTPGSCPGYKHPLSNPCPFGFQFFRKTCSCYMTSLYVFNWNQAEQHCRRHNAHLVSIHSSAEAEYVKGLFALPMQYIHVGLRFQRNGWSWSDGTPVDYLDWAPFQPHGNVHQLQCSILYGAGFFYSSALANTACSAVYNHAVCKRPL